MNHPEWLPPTSSTAPPLATRMLKLRANATFDPDQTRLAFRLIVAALMRLPDPADVSFRYEALDTDTTHFAVRFECMTESAAAHTESTAITIIRGIAPWLDVEPVPDEPLVTSDLVSVRFALGTEETLLATTVASLLWTAVSQGGKTVQYTLRLQRLILPSDGVGEARVRAEVTLSAAPQEIDALAALAGVDAAHPAALSVIAGEATRLEGELLTDIPTIARLLAGPFTVPTLNRRFVAVTATEFGDLLASVLPPHVILLGGSGQGKSTAMDHGVDEALRRGATVVVFCPHGDLAVRAASTAVRNGVEPIVYDFGALDRHLRWNVTQPDPGMRPDEWARRLSEVIRRQLWDDMPASYVAGPVGTRTLPIIFEVLARDPRGPWPLTRVPDLLDPTNSAFRKSALDRIGDPALTRAMNVEVMPMVAQTDPGNSSIWLISKVDPLIGDPTVRRIIDTKDSVVSMRPALEGRSIIVSLPESVLTEGGSTTLSALLLERLWAAARARRDPSKPIEVFVDEWQKLPSPAIPQMLAEGRKFGIRLRLANQHLAQLTDAQREAVLANTGLIGTFRTSGSDAATLDRHFPKVLMSTLQTLPRHTLAYTTGDTDGVIRMPRPAIANDEDFSRLAAPFLHDDEPAAASAEVEAEDDVMSFASDLIDTAP